MYKDTWQDSYFRKIIRIYEPLQRISLAWLGLITEGTDLFWLYLAVKLSPWLKCLSVLMKLYFLRVRYTSRSHETSFFTLLFREKWPKLCKCQTLQYFYTASVSTIDLFGEFLSKCTRNGRVRAGVH